MTLCRTKLAEEVNHATELVMSHEEANVTEAVQEVGSIVPPVKIIQSVRIFQHNIKVNKVPVQNIQSVAIFQYTIKVSKVSVQNIQSVAIFQYTIKVSKVSVQSIQSVAMFQYKIKVSKDIPVHTNS
jgi:hypothetical protein